MWAEAGRAPPFEDLFRHQSDGLGVLPNSNVGVVGASADGGEGESSWPMEAEWPEEWSTPSEREHVLAVDFDITVAVSTHVSNPAHGCFTVGSLLGSEGGCSGLRGGRWPFEMVRPEMCDWAARLDEHGYHQVPLGARTPPGAGTAPPRRRRMASSTARRSSCTRRHGSEAQGGRRRADLTVCGKGRPAEIAKSSACAISRFSLRP